MARGTGSTDPRDSGLVNFELILEGSTFVNGNITHASRAWRSFFTIWSWSQQLFNIVPVVGNFVVTDKTDRKCVVRDIDGTHTRRTDIELTPDLNEPVLEPIREYIKDLSADGDLEFSLMVPIEDDTTPECIDLDIDTTATRYTPYISYQQKGSASPSEFFADYLEVLSKRTGEVEKPETVIWWGYHKNTLIRTILSEKSTRQKGKAHMDCNTVLVVARHPNRVYCLE
ncbi:hypothetical protein EDD85DRAFT_783036 [Armillaria nabsnona]|nr:hypothetical protein EDD85DRAFT_783036 [Armillaria nabsnona]